MLSFRKLAIFCILIASVQLVRCDMTDQDRVCYKQFVEQFKELVNTKRRYGHLRKYIDIDYKSVNLFDELSDDFKSKIVKTCREEMKKLGPDTGIYDAFNKVTLNIVDGFKEIMKIKNDVVGWQLEAMRWDGNILEFLFFREQFRKNNARDLDDGVKILKNKYKRMKDEEAKLCVILHNYDWGILGEICLGKIQSGQSNEPGTYVTIDIRFKKFIAEAMASNEQYAQRGYARYERIELLDNVEHNFKLQCLKSLNNRVHAYTMGGMHYTQVALHYAYNVLHEKCTEYINKINSETKGKISPYASGMNAGNIIEYLVRQNNQNN